MALIQRIHSHKIWKIGCAVLCIRIICLQDVESISGHFWPLTVLTGLIIRQNVGAEHPIPLEDYNLQNQIKF
jgi:hypothetical protein